MFALPAQSAEISGGNLYNEQLLRALAAVHPVQVTGISECRARIEQGRSGCYFLDSLDLPSVVGLPAPQPGQAFGLLVHHLPSLEPDIRPDDPLLAVERAALSRCDVLLATSPFTAALLRARGHDAKRIVTVIPAPPSGASALPVPTPPFVFCMVGNLIPRKGFLELFECLPDQLTIGHPNALSERETRCCIELSLRHEVPFCCMGEGHSLRMMPRPLSSL